MRFTLAVAAAVLASATLTACSDQPSDGCNQEQPAVAAQLLAKASSKPSPSRTSKKPAPAKPKASKKPAKSKSKHHDHDDDCDD